MSAPDGTYASWTGRAWSCSVRLVVTDPHALAPATQDLAALLARVDAAASRFRPDSELALANARAGRPVAVSRLLLDLVDAALDAAAQTRGAVDPTVGLAMQRIGYDRDIAAIRDTGDRGADDLPPALRAGGWHRVRVYREAGLLTVPLGWQLDLGATAKAWTADHAAQTLAERHGSGVLVEIGGDLAVAGPVPGAGWRVRVAEREGGPGQVVLVRHGGVATSTTTVRHWTHAGRPMHHIVDPWTGLPTTGPWRTVSVHAPSALAANVASTNAIVRGADAEEWLRRPDGRRLAARLVDHDGGTSTIGTWPVPDGTPASRVAAAAATGTTAAASTACAPWSGRLVPRVATTSPVAARGTRSITIPVGALR